MVTIFQPQQQSSTSVRKSSIEYQKLIFLSSMAVLWWSFNLAILTNQALSQTSITFPKQEKLISQPTLAPDLSPPSTFDSENPPPESYSPAKFNSNDSQQFKVYRLNTGDGINISVPKFSEFSTLANLDEEGNVLVPILGRVALAGLSLTEAEQKISYELGTHFIQEQPEVLVSLTAPRPANVTVLGEVLKPGFYSFISGSPLTSALLAAGGTTNNADLRSIIVRRSLVDGSVLEEKIDFYTPLINSQSFPNFHLQGGDTIIVSQLEVGKDRNYDRSLIANTTLSQQTINVRVLAPIRADGGGGTTFRNLVLPNGSTFIDALASLPPVDNILLKDKVALLRFDPETGGIITQELNAQDVIRKGDIAQNIPLQNEDVIVVNRNLLGKVFNAFDQLTQPLRSVFGFRAFFNDVFN
ncbi:polysaccharide export protein [Stanieria sp. NIES-3757]|nr:polysaccharide export protein [Stanieria sp. NIES-3757]